MSYSFELPNLSKIKTANTLLCFFALLFTSNLCIPKVVVIYIGL